MPEERASTGIELFEVTEPVPMLAEPAGSAGSVCMIPGPVIPAQPAVASVIRTEIAKMLFLFMGAPKLIANGGPQADTGHRDKHIRVPSDSRQPSQLFKLER